MVVADVAPVGRELSKRQVEPEQRRDRVPIARGVSVEPDLAGDARVGDARGAARPERAVAVLDALAVGDRDRDVRRELDAVAELVRAHEVKHRERADERSALRVDVAADLGASRALRTHLERPDRVLEPEGDQRERELSDARAVDHDVVERARGRPVAQRRELVRGDRRLSGGRRRREDRGGEQEGTTGGASAREHRPNATWVRVRCATFCGKAMRAGPCHWTSG